MRSRGLSILEIVCFLAVLPAILALGGALFVSAATEAPRLQRLADSGSINAAMVRSLQRDMDRALALPASFEDAVAGERLLLIEQGHGVVSYSFDGEAVRRTVLSGPREGLLQVWTADGAKIAFAPLLAGGEPRGVVVTTAVVYQAKGRTLDRLANSRAMFLDAMPAVPQDVDQQEDQP